MTERIAKRVQALFQTSDEAFFYERAILLEEAYQIYEKEPVGRRYAHAFAYLLDHITIVVHPDELLVGAVKEIIPDVTQEKVYQQILEKPGNQFDMQDGFGFESLGLLHRSEWVKRYAPEWFFSYGHHKYSIESVLEKGFGGLRAFMSKRLSNDLLNAEQREFYENGIIICDAIERYATRTAETLRRQAVDQTEQARRAELLQMARNFERIPMHPAGSFYEAIQTVWFLQNINSNICGARDYAFGSFDQYMYPYYKRDIANGKLTKAFALELIESFFIKTNETIGFCVYFYNPKRTLSNHSVQYIYVGGEDEQGNDRINALSWLMLEAQSELKLHQPTLYVHYHNNLSPAFLRRAVEIIKEGRCDPAFYNDRVVVEALKHAGVAEADAKRFTHYGCCNINLDSMEDEIREIWNIMPKLVEITLNNGHDMLTGKLLTAEISPLEQLTDMDAIYRAVNAHFKIALERAIGVTARADAVCREKKTFSFESLLLPYCLENGVDMTKKTQYKHCNVHACGMATAGDSLYAIDRLVFREKRLTLPQLTDILKSNWQGQEQLQEEVYSTFPKFGNDNDDVDRFTVRLANDFVQEVARHSPIPNEPEGYDRLLFPTIYTLNQAIDMGRVTAASADGRSAGDTISENQSPTYGVDSCGPTAFLNSVAKLPFEYTAGGGLNFSIQPELVRGEIGTENLMRLIKGYFEQGGLHIQIMITDEKVLEDARQNPEMHRNLLVRVTGYSAYFVVLSPDLQEEIINRTKKSGGRHEGTHI